MKQCNISLKDLQMKSFQMGFQAQPLRNPSQFISLRNLLLNLSRFITYIDNKHLKQYYLFYILKLRNIRDIKELFNTSMT